MDTKRIQTEFNDYRKSVYGWAYRLLGNHHDAMDVTQEVFVKWWRAHLERESPRSAVGWLRRVTVNHSINLNKTRSRKPESKMLNRADHDSPSNRLEQSELTDLVAGVLTELTERQRDVLVAKIYDGCRFADIAEQMDLSVPTVKTHYLRALQTARQKLTHAGVVPGDV